MTDTPTPTPAPGDRVRFQNGVTVRFLNMGPAFDRTPQKLLGGTYTVRRIDGDGQPVYWDADTEIEFVVLDTTTTFTAKTGRVLAPWEVRIAR